MHRIVFIMGVSGSGKTTLGQGLSHTTHWPFYDGDDFHPDANIQKMQHGIPLTDTDRELWLRDIHQFIQKNIFTSNLIIACSALKETYRQQLSQGFEHQCRWIVLLANRELLFQRLTKRKNHFMPASLLSSQLEIFEMPTYGLHLSAQLPLENQIQQAQNYLQHE